MVENSRASKTREDSTINLKGESQAERLDRLLATCEDLGRRLRVIEELERLHSQGLEHRAPGVKPEPSAVEDVKPKERK